MLLSMQRAQRIAQTFIADEDLSRGVAELAKAVDSVNVSYVTVSPVLVGLADYGPMALDALAERIRMSDESLVDAIRRLQDLGLVTVSLADENQQASLTAEGSLAAHQLGR